jgi:hypothetical protein
MFMPTIDPDRLALALEVVLVLFALAQPAISATAPHIVAPLIVRWQILRHLLM